MSCLRFFLPSPAVEKLPMVSPSIFYVLRLRIPMAVPFSLRSTKQVRRCHAMSESFESVLSQETFSKGLEDGFMGYVTGKRRVTELAHEMWKNIVRKGDTVVDATCGNGHDTLALLKMVSDKSGSGFVYGLDIQSSAIENSSSLLDTSADPDERKLVRLFSICHSRMEEVIPNSTSVRLVAFNLGYLPGGDKSIITTPDTTLKALQASSQMLGTGGLISAMVYVGHPGGRDELEAVEAFSSGLSAEAWVCCKFETLNRSSSPVLILLYKK
ncbi:tRNA (mnm(5)s(2)U34)-methyltransferase, chloroplastic [Aristolochia californica]|uniref:tRNA (mnm(5)s(2)U34)-methyltransferase, chloroplastic n=1 Tax=Aristolochia californica TaxID=171875 RepID=UPI0035DEB824